MRSFPRTRTGFPGVVPTLLGTLLAWSAAACGDGAHEDTEEAAGQAAGSIVGGTAAVGDEAVVALTVQGQPFCTGTLVSSFVVVCAAHCIHPDVVPFPPAAIEVFFGSQVGAGGTMIPVVAGEWHPQWSSNNPQADFDVGVLRLAQPASVQPAAMVAGQLDNSFLGQSVRLVGFGITSANGRGGGIKREATAFVSDLLPNQFAFPENGQGTCNGDSGGPAFLSVGGQEVLVGIHSLSDCETFGVDERVDSHRDDFIVPFIGTEPTPTCDPDGFCATGCADVDLDCPCAPDGFCTADCNAVASDPDCDPSCASNNVCTEGCPIPDPDCAPDCVANGVCEEGCAADPDCDPCAAGACGGQAAEGEDEEDASDADDGGCHVSQRPASGSGWPHALGSALAIALLASRPRWRRRRAS